VSQLRQLRAEEAEGLGEAAKCLTKLGLTVNQARVYIALLRLGSAKASEVAKESGVERAETYRALNRLGELGLVRASVLKPTCFIPSPPEEGISRLLETYSDRLRKMREMALVAVSLLKAEQRQPPRHAALLELVVGRRRAFRKALDMINKAKVEVDCVTSGYGLKRAAKGGILDAFEEATGRKVNVKLISEVIEANLHEAKLFIEVAEFKHADQLNAFLLLVDDAEALVGVTIKEDTALDTEDHIELWTNSGFFVKAMKHFFEKAWSEAVDVHTRLDKLRKNKSEAKQ